MKQRTQIQTNIAAPWRLRNDGSMVAPAVLIRQGVMCGSRGCVLHPAESIRNSAQSWNRTPVTVDHPMVKGTPVSVKEKPDAAVGHLESARFQDGALKADIVITANDQDIRRQLQNSREVSIGVFSDEIAAQGVYEDREYSAISQFYEPDHCAIVTEGEGACSFEMGCGIRVNKALQAACANYVKQEIFNQGGINNMDNKLLPADVQEKETKENPEQIQAYADQNELLLPTQFNRGEETEKPADEEDVLLPTGMN